MRCSLLGTALCAAVAACAGSTSVGQDRTVLIQFNRAPTSADSSAVRALGARRALVVRVARAIAARGSPEARQYEALPDVLRSDDLGQEEDPLVSVFIEVVDAPTVEDSVFVAALGASTVGTAHPENRIAAVLRLSIVDRLGEYPRFTKVEIVLLTNRVTP